MTKNTKTVASVENAQLTADEQLLEIVNQMIANDESKLLRTESVTGYLGFKRGNRTLVEIHLKKRSISHCTFGSATDTFIKILEPKKLVKRVVPKSYGWRLDTECLITAEFVKYAKQIFESVVAEDAMKDAKKQEKDAKKADAPVKKTA